MAKLIEDSFSQTLVDALAKKTQFVQRSRKLSASHFVNTLMFSSHNQANTSLPDMTADLYQQCAVDISKEGLHKKFNTQAVAFLKELVKMHVSDHLQMGCTDLKKYFNAINIKDSSKFSLPTIYSGGYPGFGNFSKTNGVMCIQYEYDVLGGNWKNIALSSIRENDQKNSNESIKDIVAGELYIRDLGYITPSYLKAVSQQEASFLNRLPAQAAVYEKGKRIDWSRIHKKFDQLGVTTLDIEVTVYEKERLPCRLIIERVPDSIYKRRLMQACAMVKKHKLKGLTQQRKTRCRYNTYITNVSQQVLPANKIKQVYYLRWQIELVFKTWKSFLQIDKVKKVKKERLECQLLARLLWVLLNWRLLQSCNRHIQKDNPATGVSVLKFFKRCLAFSTTLRLVVMGKMPIRTWLIKVFLPLIENTNCEAPTGKYTHYQTIYGLS